MGRHTLHELVNFNQFQIQSVFNSYAPTDAVPGGAFSIMQCDKYKISMP